MELSGDFTREICSLYSLSETAIRRWMKDKAPISVEGQILSLEEIRKIKKEIEILIKLRLYSQ